MRSWNSVESGYFQKATLSDLFFAKQNRPSWPAIRSNQLQIWFVAEPPIEMVLVEPVTRREA
jgi:hypothetical protein